MNLSPSSNQELAVPINLHESAASSRIVGIDGNRTLGFRPDRLPEPGRHVPGAHVRITLEIVQTQAVDVGAAKTRSVGEGRRYVSWGRHLSTVAREPTAPHTSFDRKCHDMDISLIEGIGSVSVTPGHSLAEARSANLSNHSRP